MFWIKKGGRYQKYINRGYNTCHKEMMLKIDNILKRNADEKKILSSNYKKEKEDEIKRILDDEKQKQKELLNSERKQKQEIIDDLLNRIENQNNEISRLRKENQKIKIDYNKFVHLKSELNFLIPRVSAACEKWAKHTAKEAMRINQEFQDIIDDMEFIDNKHNKLEDKKFKVINQA